MVTLVVMFIICKHTKLKSLVTSLALQQIKEVGAVINRNISQFYMIFNVHVKSNCTQYAMIFILDAQYYVPVKLCGTASSIPLLKLQENYFWNILN